MYRGYFRVTKTVRSAILPPTNEIVGRWCFLSCLERRSAQSAICTIHADPLTRGHASPTSSPWSGGRHPLPSYEACIPPPDRRHVPLPQTGDIHRFPPGQEACSLPSTRPHPLPHPVNWWAVWIILECILVLKLWKMMLCIYCVVHPNMQEVAWILHSINSFQYSWWDIIVLKLFLLTNYSLQLYWWHIAPSSVMITNKSFYFISSLRAIF